MQKPLNFQAGKWLRESSLYVDRYADGLLLARIKEGRRIICLAEPHQSGKTSLCYRILDQVQAEGIPAVYLDLQSIVSSGATESECYFSIARRINNELGLSKEAFLSFSGRYGKDPHGFCREFLTDLSKSNARVIIFLDEIGLIQTADMSFDGFFSAVQTAKNVSFVLAGVFTSHFMEKKSSVYAKLEKSFVPLKDFTRPEMAGFLEVFQEFSNIDAAKLIDEIYDWTSGQPYMAQKIGEVIVSDCRSGSAPNVTAIVRELFLKDYIYSDVILASINANFDIFLGDSSQRRYDALRIYENLLKSNLPVPISRLNEKLFPVDREMLDGIIEDLSVCGLIAVDNQSYVRSRNRICRQLFDEKWVEDRKHDTEELNG
jgi:hypothetical protein